MAAHGSAEGGGWGRGGAGGVCGLRKGSAGAGDGCGHGVGLQRLRVGGAVGSTGAGVGCGVVLRVRGSREQATPPGVAEFLPTGYLRARTGPSRTRTPIRSPSRSAWRAFPPSGTRASCASAPGGSALRHAAAFCAPTPGSSGSGAYAAVRSRTWRFCALVPGGLALPRPAGVSMPAFCTSVPGVLRFRLRAFYPPAPTCSGLSGIRAFRALRYPRSGLPCPPCPPCRLCPHSRPRVCAWSDSAGVRRGRGCRV